MPVDRQPVQFAAGQPVRCVDPRDSSGVLAAKGSYTVRSVRLTLSDGRQWIALSECPEYTWSASRFVPIAPTSTDQ